MTRYDRLAKFGEHIFSMTDREVKYLYRHLKKHGILTRVPSDEKDHTNILEACRSLLHGKE